MPLREKNSAPFSVLINTPVWQNYFLKKERTFREVNALMDAGRVCCLDLIAAELLCLAETTEEMKVCRIYLYLSGSTGVAGVWIGTARLAFKLRRRGKGLPLRDCFVAIMAQSHGALPYMTNKPLRRVGKAMDLELEFFPERRTLE